MIGHSFMQGNTETGRHRVNDDVIQIMTSRQIYHTGFAMRYVVFDTDLAMRYGVCDTG